MDAIYCSAVWRLGLGRQEGAQGSSPPMDEARSVQSAGEGMPLHCASIWLWLFARLEARLMHGRSWTKLTVHAACMRRAKAATLGWSSHGRAAAPSVSKAVQLFN